VTFDDLVNELIRIGSSQGFLKNPDVSNAYFREGENIRAREIGEILNQRGGLDLMRKAGLQVSRALPMQARELEFAWGGIGDWKS